MLNLDEVVRHMNIAILQEFLLKIPLPVHIINKNMEIWRNIASRERFQEVIEGSFCYEVLNGKKEICPRCSVSEVFKTGRGTSKRKNYRKKILEIEIVPIFDEAGTVAYVMEAVYDITAEVRKQEKVDEAIKELSELAKTDYLTKIANRSGILEWIEQELGRSKRFNQKFGLAMFDIDHFKSINDKYGHAAGDQVLCEVTSLISKRAREIDRFGRYGGEEFILVLPNTDVHGAFRLTEDIRKEIAKNRFTDYSIRITMSGGIVEVSGDDDLEDVLKTVDSALYQSKNTGRNKMTTVMIKKG